jgi:hypothetical protein
MKINFSLLIAGFHSPHAGESKNQGNGYVSEDDWVGGQLYFYSNPPPHRLWKYAVFPWLFGSPARGERKVAHCVMNLLRCTLFLLFLFSTAQAKNAPAPPRTVVGYVEYVSVPKVTATLKAKMDTGAKTSSIHANIIEFKKHERGNEDSGYVIFTIKTKDGESKPIKKPITRIVRIKLKNGGFERRPVVQMQFCMAGVRVDDEVNLSNREDFIYDVLVGRNMLEKGGLVVDASRALSMKPNCAEDKAVKVKG